MTKQEWNTLEQLLDKAAEEARQQGSKAYYLGDVEDTTLWDRRFEGFVRAHVFAKRIVRSMNRSYDDLTVEEKARIAAQLLNGGFNEHGDSCKWRQATGRYDFTPLTGKPFSLTPEDLLRTFVEWFGEEPLKEELE